MVATVRPRVERSSAAECVSAPTTSTCFAAPERTIAAAVASPYTKPEHWLRMSIVGTNLGSSPSSSPSFCWSSGPAPGKHMSGESVANKIMSRSRAVSFASSSACFAARHAMSDVPTPSSANRRASMPVRCTIHSWVVSIPYSFASASFVTTLGGT